MSAVRSTALVVLFSVLLAPLPASAQTTDTDPPADTAATIDARERARALIERGNTAFAAHDYVAALAAFREAHDAVPLAQIRFNVARCLERLGRFREATAEYRAVVASAELAAEERARAERELDAVSQRLGTLEVRGPSGVAIEIDGALTCAIPCEEPLDPGEHDLRDPSGTRRRVSIERGATATVSWALAEPTRADAADAPVAEPDRVGGLAIAGGIVTAIGVAGIVGFGLRVETLENEFDGSPNHATADEGVLMAGFANASIGVAVVGAVLILVDLLRAAL